VRRGVAVLLLVPLLSACGSDQDGYCDAVQDHQGELSEIVGSGEPNAMLDALEIFRDLQDRAPADIADEWQQVVGSVEALQEALDDAGVDGATYDRAHPPAGVSAAQQKVIDAAAARVGSAETLEASKDLDQQARDVCHTPLTL
jgi:hypothetical protein